MSQLAASGFDGVVAKELDCAYASGERSAMRKIKRIRTADCVVGGFRYASKGGQIGSLLLGLYDEKGLLNHVGFSSSFSAAERKPLKQALKPYMGGCGIYRACAGRSEPLEHRTQRPVGAAGSEAGMRGAVRPLFRRPLPARHKVSSLASREKSEELHLRTGRAGK